MFKLKSLVDAFVSEALARSRPVVAWAVEHKPKTLAGWLAFSSAAGAACAVLATLAVAWLSVFAFAAVVLCGATLFLCFALGVWLALSAWLAVALAVAAGCAAGWLLLLRGGVQLVAAVGSRALPRALSLSGMADRGLWPAPSAHKAAAATATAAPAAPQHVPAPPATTAEAPAAGAPAAPASAPKASSPGTPSPNATSLPHAAADRHHHPDTSDAGTIARGLSDTGAGRGRNTAGSAVPHTTHTPTTTSETLVTASATSPPKGGRCGPLGEMQHAPGSVQGGVDRIQGTHVGGRRIPDGEVPLRGVDREPFLAMLARTEALFDRGMADLGQLPEMMDDMTRAIMQLQDIFARMPVRKEGAPAGVELRCDREGGPAGEGEGCVRGRLREGVVEREGEGDGEEERGLGGVGAVGGGAGAGAGAVQQEEEGSGQEGGGGAGAGEGGAGGEGGAEGVGGLAGGSGKGRNGRGRVSGGRPAGQVSVSA